MIRSCLLSATLLACAGLARASDPVHARFLDLDANRDGRIDASEHAGAAQEMFKQMDVNLDGRITAEEMRVTRKAMDEPADEAQVAAAIKAMDRNGDGKVDPAEHAGMAQALFRKADTDGDGALSEDELRQAAIPAAS